MSKTIERLVLKYLVKVVYTGSRIFPVRNRVVFATNRTTVLVDNFKFLDAELKKQGLNYEHVYLLKKIGTGVWGRLDYLIHLLEATYYLATSKFFIIDDFYFPVYVIHPRKGTEVIQTWHACGAFKKFGYSILDKEYGADNNYVKYIPIHRNYAHVLVSSKEVIPYYAEAFNMEKENICPLGIPRTDLFFNKTLKQEAVNKVYQTFPILRNKRLILYAPTFRGASQANMHMDIPFELDQVLASLKEGDILGLKMHPFIKNLPDLECFPNVIDLSSYPEVNEILLVTDLLITDYSSLIFEYALLERPMIFYANDREIYMKERDFYYEYESFIPGPLVDTTEGLVEVLKNEEYDMQQVKRFKETFFDQIDGKASERVVREVFKK